MTTLQQPDRSAEIGRSWPIMTKIPNFQAVAVANDKGDMKFQQINSDKFLGKYLVMIFMDNRLSETEIKEWISISNHLNTFKNTGVAVVGVATVSQTAIRTWMSTILSEIKFPIISDKTGDLSRCFGVMNTTPGREGGARALAIVDAAGVLVHISINNELAVHDYLGICERIRTLQTVEENGSIIITRSVRSESQSSDSKRSEEKGTRPSDSTSFKPQQERTDENPTPEGNESKSSKQTSANISEESKISQENEQSSGLNASGQMKAFWGLGNTISSWFNSKSKTATSFNTMEVRKALPTNRQISPRKKLKNTKDKPKRPEPSKEQQDPFKRPGVQERPINKAGQNGIVGKKQEGSTTDEFKKNRNEDEDEVNKVDRQLDGEELDYDGEDEGEEPSEVGQDPEEDVDEPGEDEEMSANDEDDEDDAGKDDFTPIEERYSNREKSSEEHQHLTEGEEGSELQGSGIEHYSDSSISGSQQEKKKKRKLCPCL